MTGVDTRGCRRWRRTLLASVDGELDAVARLEFEAHVAGCASCEAALLVHLRLEELLHLDAGVEPDGGFEDRIVAGVFDRIDRDGAPSNAPPPPSRRPGLAVPAAAAALALVSLGLGLRRAPETTPSPRPAAVDAPASSPGGAVADAAPAGRALEEVIVPARLAAARATVDAAFLEAEEADDYRSAFERRTATLRGRAWPIDEIVVGAIDAGDPAAARRAIRAASELAIDRAVPALRRAARRDATADAALVALGALGDQRSIERLARGLADPDLRDAAADGLARLATAASARRVADSTADGTPADVAERVLLRMGPVGVGELLRRRAAGDEGAARRLFEAGRPTPDETLHLLDAGRHDEAIVRAALPEAAAAGEAALPLLARLLARPGTAGPAADAMVAIGGPAAALHLATAAAPRSERWDRDAFEAFVDGTIRRIVRADPTRTHEIAALARHAGGERIVRALDAPSAPLTRGLEAVFADRRAPSDRRALAALALADAGRFDPSLGLAAVFELALVDEGAAADVLCAAVRASDAPPAPAALAPLGRALADRLLRRAEVVAERWRRDGERPRSWERRGIEKLLSRAVPRL
ncbi:MAG: zf-HC2 domain-containing protein [Planctomycetota bacterium JB042]